MPTTYSFIFPTSQEEAGNIYAILYSPSTGSPFQGVNVPNLVEDSSRPQPPLNHTGQIVSETDEIIRSLGEAEHEEEDSELSSDEDVEEENLILPFNRNQAAITKQLEVRLAHELQQTVPRLFGIQALLEQLGGNVPQSSQLQELHHVSHSILTYLQSLPVPLETGPVPAPITSSTHVKETNTNPASQANSAQPRNNTSEKKRTLVPPSPERSQKRKRSTATF
ncbi:hypothetical protein M422DRAFT_264259 [Sphaerobolus stellatus SS14]|uniref:Uncharacterized protein n=1 Tax=Sphaerobolus stellatus (strain SS14) TaxID=990650 RepID=A0A0C9UWY5_SPHS4|nr:hypothetical protein M422DRAFT_264259 [Sphaerobolus stellatus SS14]